MIADAQRFSHEKLMNAIPNDKKTKTKIFCGCPERQDNSFSSKCLLSNCPPTKSMIFNNYFFKIYHLLCKLKWTEKKKFDPCTKT